MVHALDTKKARRMADLTYICVSLEREKGLVIETARQFGFDRLGDALSTRLKGRVQHLVRAEQLSSSAGVLIPSDTGSTP